MIEENEVSKPVVEITQESLPRNKRTEFKKDSRVLPINKWLPIDSVDGKHQITENRSYVVGSVAPKKDCDTVLRFRGISGQYEAAFFELVK